MNEIEAMKAVANTLEQLAKDERERVIAWAGAKFGSAVQSAGVSPSVELPKPAPKSKPTKATAKQKSLKKGKSIISMDKNVNLSPKGKKSAAQFAAEKRPPNAKQKFVVAVYYLRDVIALGSISVSAIYTFFKTVGWPLPSNIKNMLSQAGTEGWLDTSNFDDIKLTTIGENLVEHSLPPQGKA